MVDDAVSCLFLRVKGLEILVDETSMDIVHGSSSPSFKSNDAILKQNLTISLVPSAFSG